MENKNESNENEKTEIIGKERYDFSENSLIDKNNFVYKSFDKKEKKNVALKLFNIENLKEEEINNLINQINKFKSIKNFYSIKILDYFKDEINFYLVMELCDDNLNNYIKKNGKINDINKICKIIYQINQVLKEIKELNIIHQNLNLNNILINYTNEEKTNFNIKISDYNLDINKNSNKNEKFKAPEIKNNDNIDYKADFYSIGIILYFLINEDFPKDLEKINNENKDLENLLKNILNADKIKRLEWNDYINHPLMIKYINNLLIQVFPDLDLNDNKYEIKDFNYLNEDNNRRKYIGQVLKGTTIQEGKGIRFDENENRIFEGELKNGKYNGYGKSYYENGK